jgi:hypothetical protein
MRPLVLLVLLVLGASAREVVPTPPGGGPGVHRFAVDNQPPAAAVPRPDALPRWSAGRSPRWPSAPASRLRDQDGGDDIAVATIADAYRLDIAAASNGHLFVATQEGRPGDPHDYRVIIRRSTDGGTTWHQWASFEDAKTRDPALLVAEGAEDRVFLAYEHQDWPHVEVRVAWSPLDVESGEFSSWTTVYSAEGHHILGLDLACDAINYDSYFLYLVFAADDGDGGDIHFARSIDQGDSFEAQYTLASIAFSDRTYESPSVAYGYGGHVHVAWDLYSRTGDFDGTLRYRVADAFAGGGLSAWSGLQSLTPHQNAMHEWAPELAASPTSPHVAMAYRRIRENPLITQEPGVLASDDHGATFAPEILATDLAAQPGALCYQLGTARYVLPVNRQSRAGLVSAPRTDPAAWTPFTTLGDAATAIGGPAACLDASHDDRVGLAWFSGPDAGLWFDACWRDDPGYPVLDAGFPVALPATPVSDPAISDLDGDGRGEVVFGDAARRVQVIRHDGSPRPGWPVETGAALWASPVAVGDLDGDGDQEVIAGTTDGRVLAYDHDGAPLAGWPVTMGPDAAVHLAIGAVGGPYPRAVIAAAGEALRCLDHHGAPYPDTVLRVFADPVTAAPVCGDLDGDGRSEVVVATGDRVFGFSPRSAANVLSATLPAAVSGNLALADFDRDGDVEVVVPLESGELHLLQEDGTAFPGAWPVTVATSRLEGVAVASYLGDAAPEIAVTVREWTVTTLWADGDPGLGWPADTDGWFIHGAPVIGRVEGGSPDVVVGARGQRGWAWDNFGRRIDGWPRHVDHHIYRTPAYGDLDLDGAAEVVLLSAGELLVLDVGSPPSDPAATWAMAGHDAGRSGCHDCALDVVAAPAAGTRVHLAAPWPNPVGAGGAAFACAVPVRARVELSICDLRGRRIATVTRAEQPAGRHVLAWDGRDRRGRPVASGTYLAVLRVDGPGVRERLTRKVVVLR